MKIETGLGDTDKWWEVRQVQSKSEKMELGLMKVEAGLKKVEKVRRARQALLGRGLSK